MAEAQRSKDLSVADAALVIEGLSDYDAILAFVGDDRRRGIPTAVGVRGLEIAGAEPQPVQPVQQARADTDRPLGHEGADLNARRDPQNGTIYFEVPGQDPDSDVVTLAGWRGEAGKAIPREDFSAWAER